MGSVLHWAWVLLPIAYAVVMTVLLLSAARQAGKLDLKKVGQRLLLIVLPAAAICLVLYFLKGIFTGNDIISSIVQILSAIVFKWILSYPLGVVIYAIWVTVTYLHLRHPQYDDMFRYIGKRLLMFIPTIIIISFLVFFIIQLPPGDYVTSYVAAMAAEGEIFTVEQIEDLRMQYGLDDPWFVQYFNWIKDIVTEGDFGYSFEYGRDVWSVIMDRLYLTLAVSLIILLFQYGVSLPIGIYCANHQYSAGDYIWSFFGFIGTATPNFLLAIIIMYYIYMTTGDVYLGLFSTEMLQNGMRWEYVPEFLGRCAIPLIVIGTSGTCGIIRTVRAQMLDEQARQYTLCARAKGCSEATITYKYCLRAALNPVVSGLAGSLRTIFSGSTVSAIVMNLAIQGPVLLAALKSQDMYLAGTTVLIQAVLVLVGTLLSDIALAWLDPRIRFAERG